MTIHIKDVSKSFGNFQALKDIDLTIQTGELVALLGPSGSGKTSLLRVIAGLEEADEGSVLFDSQDITNKHSKDRHVGFVFQHYALFEHMNVADNISYGLRVRSKKTRPSKEKINEKVTELLHLVKLEGLEKRLPSQLSGGQRQRVALARALAVEPKILLLDEPFGALDAKVRKDLRKWLRRLHSEFNVTSVFVTHDQEEALDVSDRVVVMNEGKIEQIGSPSEVYDNPNSPFVFDFLGDVNVFQGRLENGKLHSNGRSFSTVSDGEIRAESAFGYVRPHQLDISKELNGEDSILSRVDHIHPVGAVVFIELTNKSDSSNIEVELAKDRFDSLFISVGDDVYVRPISMKVFEANQYQI